jgi:hypothetical protein
MLRVVEGIHGLWRYHLAPAERQAQALCGAKTMVTSIPLSAWGHRSDHLYESYCEKCARSPEGRAALKPQP